MLHNPQDLIDSIDPKFSSLLEKMNANNINFKDFALEKNRILFPEHTHADTVLFSMFNFNTVKHINFLQNFKEITHYKVDINRSTGVRWTEIVTSTEDTDNVVNCIVKQFRMAKESKVKSNENLASFSDSNQTIVINKIKDSEWHLIDSNISRKIKTVFKGIHSKSHKDKVVRKFKKINKLINSTDYYGNYFDDNYIRETNCHSPKEIYSLELNNFVAVFKEVMEHLCEQSLSLSLCQELFSSYFEIDSWHIVSQAEKNETITPYSIDYNIGGAYKQFLVKDFSDAMAIYLELSKDFENVMIKPCNLNENSFHSTYKNHEEESDFRFYARPSTGIFKEQCK